jgi:tetratricopeptide (TPR) repeat protein
MPLERLFGVNHDSSEYNKDSAVGLFYAESWALVHYLMRGDSQRTSQLGRFLVLLQHGTAQDTAFREAFGTDYAGLLAELVKYVHGSRFTYSRLSFADLKISSNAEVRNLDYPETLFRLGDLLAHESDERFGDAEAHLQAALALTPSHSGALAAMGWLRIRQERYEEAATFLEKTVLSGAGDYRAHFHYGELLMRFLSGEVIAVGKLNSRQRWLIDDARRALRRSIELNGDFPEARAALGRTYLVEDDSCLWEGIQELEAAMQGLPFREDVALDLARLYERKGERLKSELIVKSVLGPEAAKALVRKQESQGFEKTLERVNRLLAEAKEDEAIPLFEQFLSGLPEDMRAAYQDQLLALRRGAARNRTVRQYNEAIGLLNKKDLEGALILFEKVAATGEDADLAKAAGAKADQIRQTLRAKRAKRSSSHGD